MRNIWLEKDEPRKRFFKIAYKLISCIAFLSRAGRTKELYEIYASYIHSYKRLDVLLRLYDQNVIAVHCGIEAALDLYFQNDSKIDEIFIGSAKEVTK